MTESNRHLQTQLYIGGFLWSVSIPSIAGEESALSQLTPVTIRECRECRDCPGSSTGPDTGRPGPRSVKMAVVTIIAIIALAAAGGAGIYGIVESVSNYKIIITIVGCDSCGVNVRNFWKLVMHINAKDGGLTINMISLWSIYQCIFLLSTFITSSEQMIYWQIRHKT